MNIWVILPGLNEHTYLDRVLAKVAKQTKQFIYVDDGSTDDSVAIAKAHTPHVLHHEVNLGKGAALQSGADYAFEKLSADAVVFMDSDDQHDARELAKFFAALESGAPLVYGARRMGSDMPFFRFFGNKLASVLLNVLFGSYVPDIPSGFKAMTKETYERVRWQARGYEVEAEIAALAAKAKIPFAVVEIQSIYHDTDKGMTLLDALGVAKFLLQLRLP